MESSRLIQDDQAIGERIMAAALTRFRHYGYNKTTMAEIAADSDMSSANIYRYFENKQEIASQCVINCIRERIRRVEVASEDSGLKACDRLRRLVLAMLESCHETYSRDVKIHELVLFITNERPDIVDWKIETFQQLLAGILKDGNASGEFDVRDINTTARAIYAAIAVFDIPLFMGFYPLEVFRQRANEVIDLVLEGLRACGRTRSRHA